MANGNYNREKVTQIWQQAKELLQAQLSPAAFNTWILANPLVEILAINDQLLHCVFATPTAFHATNLKKNLYAQLQQALATILQQDVELEFTIQDPAQIVANQKSLTTSRPTAKNRPSAGFSLNSATQTDQVTTNFVNQPLANNQFADFSTAQNPATTNLNQPAASFSAANNSSSPAAFRSAPNQPVNQPSFGSTPAYRHPGSSSPRVEELFSQHTLEISQQDQALVAAKRAGLRLDYKFNTFAVSSSNEMAHAAATAVSNQPGQAYNPLFLYGGVGVGKTHLMQAIGHNILEQDPRVRVIYCTGEEFTNEIISAIQNKNALQFKNKYRHAQVLLIDDIQFIAGKNAVQEEFFHTFNALVKQAAQVILTSDRPPSEINLLEDRLRSRFEAGLMIDIQQPSLELRTAIVLIKAKANNLNLPINLAEIIANQVDSARKIEGIITLIRSSVELRGVAIDESLIAQILAKEQSNQPNRLRLKPQKIIKCVSDFYQLKPAVVRGQKRNKEYVLARHLAMFLLKTELNMSLVEIGRWFTNRDHTSVMHAKDKIEELLHTDPNFQDDFSQIKTDLLKQAG